jgi:hypothetical protein
VVTTLLGVFLGGYIGVRLTSAYAREARREERQDLTMYDLLALINDAHYKYLSIHQGAAIDPTTDWPAYFSAVENVIERFYREWLVSLADLELKRTFDQLPALLKRTKARYEDSETRWDLDESGDNAATLADHLDAALWHVRAVWLKRQQETESWNRSMKRLRAAGIKLEA